MSASAIPSRRAAGRFDLLIAIAIAVAIYAVGLFAMRVNLTAEKPGTTTAPRNYASVFSLPQPPQFLDDPANPAPPEERRQALKWQKQLLAWAELQDPTMMSLPHPANGFSRVRKYEFVRPVERLPLRPLPATAVTPHGTPHLVLSAPVNDLDTAVADERLYAAPQRPSVQTPETPAAVLWTNAVGKRFEHLPPLAVPEGSGYQTRGPSRLLVQPGSRTTRVHVMRSCGAPALDQLAVTHLRKHLLPKLANPKLHATEPLLAAPQSIYVYWQHVDSVNDVNEPGHRERWHDLD